MIPLYGFLEGDTIGLLMLAQEGETVGELALRLQMSASVRVATREHVALIYKGNRIPPELTVARAGLEALDRFDVIAEREAAHATPKPRVVPR
jgi:hypothetical protein